MADRPGLLTPRQVARAIGVSEASVKRWCDQGVIETTRTAGGHRRLRADSVTAFLRESGHTVVQPEVLGLPSTSGHTARIINRGCNLFVEALRSGQRDVAWQTIADLRQADHSLASIGDHVITTAMSKLAGETSDKPEAEYRTRRANVICLRIIHDLHSELPLPGANAPAGYAAALDGEEHDLTVSLAELILRSVGWNASSLGTGLPFHTLKQAIRDHAPRILCVQIPLIRDESRLVREFISLRRVAANRGSRVAVIGRWSASETLRERIHSDDFCETFTELELLARKHRPKR